MLIVANWTAARLGHHFKSEFVTFLELPAVLFGFGLLNAYAIELYFVGYEGSSLQMLLSWDPQIKYDLFYFIVPYTALYPILTDLMTGNVGTVSWPWIEWVKDALPVSAVPFFPLQIVLTELGVSFLQYWQHRALHTFPVLWETHKFHHSCEKMTGLSYGRESPFTVAFNSTLIALPAAVIGTFLIPKQPTTGDYIALGIWTLYSLFNTMNQFLVHSNLRLTYGWFGRYCIISPANHRVHHSALPEHFNANYSVTHVLWDRLFGTFHEGVDEVAQTCPVGYPDNIYNKSKWVVDEFFYPMVAFFVALYRLLDRQVRARPALHRFLLESWQSMVIGVSVLAIGLAWSVAMLVCFLRPKGAARSTA